MGQHILEFFGVRQFFKFTVGKRTRMFVLQMKSKVFFIQPKKWVNSKQEKVTELESRKLHICPKVTRVGCIIGHRIVSYGVGALRGQSHTPQKLTQVPPPPPPVRDHLRAESHFVFLSKKEERRLCLYRVNPFKSPQPRPLYQSILFSHVKVVFSSASIRLLINRRSQLSPLYQALAVLPLKRKLTLRAEPKKEERRFCKNLVNPLKSPQPRPLYQSILCSLVKLVFSSASIRLLIN